MLPFIFPGSRPLYPPVQLAGTINALGTGVAPPAPYVGPVATRTRVPDSFSAPNKQCMSRNYFRLTEDVVSLKLVYPNWHLATGAETAGGGATIAASILPSGLGSRTQVTWNGGATSIAITTEDFAVSDEIPWAGTKGDKIFIDTYWAGVTQLLYTNMYDAAGGEQVSYGASIANTTMSDWVGANSAVSVRPCAILATTRKGTVYVLGDSRSVGTIGSTISNIEQGEKAGEICRSLGYEVGHINGGRFGHSLVNFRGNNSRQAQLFQYVTDIIIQIGVNDPATRSLAQMQSDTQYVRDLSGKRCWLTTKPPRATSTDSFATLANQTPFAQASVLSAYNDWVRSLPSGFVGFFEIGDVLEDTRSGKWKVNGSPNYVTSDGVHEVSNGYALIEAANVIPLSSFSR